MKIEIDQQIDKYIENMPLIVLGDMNGHLGFIGDQKLNENGIIVLEWLNKGLLLLNCDQNCEGKYTWRRKDQNNLIDFVVCISKCINV